MSDADLRQDILDELEFDPCMNAHSIGVAVVNGVVSLSGYVGSCAEKRTAVIATKRVRGVRAVADDIEVRYPHEKTTPDDEIAQRVADVLDWDIVVPSGSIQAVVREGWVTLTGTVDWQYQRKAAEDDVRKLSGVHGVVNSIMLKARVIHTDEVKKKIEDALKRHAEVEAEGIRVSVEDGGQVILEGKVGNWDERNAVEVAVWSAPGVCRVVDRLTIS
jgi:hyperosmotically inducible protein